VLAPPTVIDAPLSVDTGVSVIDATAFTTVAVYDVVPDANAGDRLPELSTNPLKLASEFTDAALVTNNVYVVLGDVGVS
jgi:hypothetical protein